MGHFRSRHRKDEWMDHNMTEVPTFNWSYTPINSFKNNLKAGISQLCLFDIVHLSKDCYLSMHL